MPLVALLGDRQWGVCVCGSHRGGPDVQESQEPSEPQNKLFPASLSAQKLREPVGGHPVTSHLRPAHCAPSWATSPTVMPEALMAGPDSCSGGLILGEPEERSLSQGSRGSGHMDQLWTLERLHSHRIVLSFVIVRPSYWGENNVLWGGTQGPLMTLKQGCSWICLNACLITLLPCLTPLSRFLLELPYSSPHPLLGSSCPCSGHRRPSLAAARAVFIY